MPRITNLHLGTLSSFLTVQTTKKKRHMVHSKSEGLICIAITFLLKIDTLNTTVPIEFKKNRQHEFVFF